MDDRKFSKEVRDSAEKIRAAGSSRNPFWEQASWLGVGGWLFVVPVVGGAYLGRWLDRRFPGSTSWTITCLVLGIAVGGYNFWHFYGRRSGR